jgi:hypothetical protein
VRNSRAGAQQPGKFFFALGVQACIPSLIRFARVLCYRTGKNLFIEKAANHEFV